MESSYSPVIVALLLILVIVAVLAYRLWLRRERVRRREMALYHLEQRLRAREITEREYEALRWDLESSWDQRNGKVRHG